MLQTSKKGFTLIELLVVITIIGILATGAVASFTSQIQKARDATRIKDVDTLKTSIEMVYQDESEYPGADLFFSKVNNHLERLPSDPKHSQNCNDGGGSTDVFCGYTYITGADSNGITQGTFEVSTAFENSGNRENKAVGDNGNDDLRYETGIDVGSNDTSLSDSFTEGNGSCLPAGSVATSATDKIIINGNPSSGECS